MNVFLKQENKEAESGDQMKKNYRISSIKPKCKVNVWGGICLNGKISLRFLNENMNTDLYLDILKEKWNEKFMRKRIYINER